MARNRRVYVDDDGNEVIADERDTEVRPRGRYRAPKPVALAQVELDALADEFSCVIDDELGDRGPRERDWMKWIRLYRAQPEHAIKRYPIPQGSSNIVVPLIQQSTNKFVAKIMRSCFAAEPFWTAQQRNRAFAQYAKPLEQYLDAVRQDVWDQYETIKDFVSEVCKLGTSALYQDWIDEPYRAYDNATGQTVERGRRVGPAPRWVSRENVLVPTGYYDVQTAPWCAVRNWYSGARLRQLEFADQVESVDDVLGHEDDETLLQVERRRHRERTHGDDLARPDSGLYAAWNVMFTRDLDDDGWPEQYMMLLHASTKTIMRLQPNPYVTGMRPLIIGRFIKQESDFDGMGIAEILEHLQDEASTIHNERRDNAHLANIRMWQAPRGSGITDQIVPKHGKVILTSGPQDLREIVLSDRRQVDAFEENVVMQLANSAVGADTVGGNVTSPVGRAAATTIMAVLQEGAERSDLNISDVRKALSEQAAQVCELYQTHGVPEPDVAGSPEAFLDAEPAALVRELLGIRDDLRGLVKLKLNAATAAVNREVEKQTTVQLQGIIVGYIQQQVGLTTYLLNPQVPGPMKEALIRGSQTLDITLKKLLQAFGAFDLEGVLMADAIAQMTAQPQQPIVPQAAPGAAPEAPVMGPANGTGVPVQ